MITKVKALECCEYSVGVHILKLGNSDIRETQTIGAGKDYECISDPFGLIKWKITVLLTDAGHF